MEETNYERGYSVRGEEIVAALTREAERLEKLLASIDGPSAPYAWACAQTAVDAMRRAIEIAAKA